MYIIMWSIIWCLCKPIANRYKCGQNNNGRSNVWFEVGYVWTRSSMGDWPWLRIERWNWLYFATTQKSSHGTPGAHTIRCVWKEFLFQMHKNDDTCSAPVSTGLALQCRQKTFSIKNYSPLYRSIFIHFSCFGHFSLCAIAIIERKVVHAMIHH